MAASALRRKCGRFLHCISDGTPWSRNKDALNYYMLLAAEVPLSPVRITQEHCNGLAKGGWRCAETPDRFCRQPRLRTKAALVSLSSQHLTGRPSARLAAAPDGGPISGLKSDRQRPGLPAAASVTKISSMAAITKLGRKKAVEVTSSSENCCGYRSNQEEERWSPFCFCLAAHASTFALFWFKAWCGQACWWPAI